MDDFNSFVNHTEQREEANNAPPADLSRLIRQLAGKYNGANETELMQAIYKEAEKGRRNGTLSDADLDRFGNMLAPMLDDAKRRKLRQIIQKLKNIR